ncbi:MAG: PTS sugar transporter subunit IIC [[Clostridium] scindens]
MSDNMFLLAVIVGLIYFVSWSEHTLANILQAPIVLGAVFGLIFGDLSQGIILGAGIQLIYMGAFSIAANMPSDYGLASRIAIPAALAAGLDVETAVVLAVPFGVLGGLLDNVRRVVNGYWVHKAEKDIDKLDIRAIEFDATVGPLLVRLYFEIFPLQSLHTWEQIMQTLWCNDSDWMMLDCSFGWSASGNRFVMAILAIGRQHLLPYFVIGFYTVDTGGLSTVSWR